MSPLMRLASAQMSILTCRGAQGLGPDVNSPLEGGGQGIALAQMKILPCREGGDGYCLSPDVKSSL